MPKVSAEHGEQVRTRIVEATIRALAERGLDDLTIADVVRESGLSVGAIYTWYSGKAELVAAACDVAVEAELAAMGTQLAALTTTRDRLLAAVRFWFDFLEREPGEVRFQLQLWAEATRTPEIRAVLQRRRQRILAAAAALLADGIERGDLPAGLEVTDIALGFIALLDGQIVQRLEEGDRWSRQDAERRATLWVELLLSAASRAG
jgi:AcrR family transcriptional regulator